jgi:pimeloyl-ACP methyl ester carboxylesterase
MAGPKGDSLAGLPLAQAADFGHERREALLLPAGGGQCVGATLHCPLPAPARIGHAVVLLPGWSGPRTGPAELLTFLARRLSDEQALVLRLDFHGRGDSSGRFLDCDLDRMIRDAEVGFEFLRSRAPDARLAAGGICSGANVALGLASLRPGAIAMVLALSALPFQPARTATFERRRRWRNLKQYAARALRPATWMKLLRGEVDLGRVKKHLTVSEKPAAGERNLKDSARDIEKELLAWKGRALFVWGSGDEEGPAAQAHFRKLHAAGCASEARFEVIAGANHNFYRLDWREELSALVNGFVTVHDAPST